MGVLPQTVLSACQALWNKSRKASLQSAILFGTAGLGKSFFLRQFAAQLAPDACWLVGQGFLQGLLSTGFTHLQNERNPDFVSAARRYCPDLPWTVLVSHMPLERERAWAAVGHAVERLAVRLGGLCLLLEDIHGYNTDDLAALRFLYRQWLHLKAPIFILSSSRPKLIDGLLEDLAVDAQLYQADAVQVFELHALDLLGVQGLAQQLLPNAEVPIELIQWLFLHSEGHPLYATELLRFLLTGGALKNLGATWQFILPPDTTVPFGLEAVLLARLEVARVEPDTFMGLSHLAVLGQPISLLTWKNLTHLPAETMQRISRRLIGLGLVSAVLQHGDAMFEIAHPLYRPLLLGLLSESERIAAHQRAFVVVLEVGLKATHARAAQHPEMLPLTRVALQHYGQNYQWADYLVHAYAALEMPLEVIERPTILEQMSLALVVQNRFLQALELLKNHDLQTPIAIARVSYCLARLVRDQEGYEFTNLHIEAFNWHIRYYWTCFPMRLGLQEIGWERLEQAFSLSQADTWERYRALMCQHWYLKIYQSQSLGQQIGLFNEAIRIETLLSGMSISWYWQAEIYALLGEFSTAQEIMDLALENYRIKPEDGEEANLLIALGRIAFAKHKNLEARGHFLAALRVASSSLDTIHQSYAHFGLYCTDYALGFEHQSHLRRYQETNAKMNFIRYDAPTDLEIAWREAAHQRLEPNQRQKIIPLLEQAKGSDCLAAARLFLLEGNNQVALQVLQNWKPETWLEEGVQRTQTRPAEHALLEAMALRNSGKKSVSMRALETALELTKDPVLQAEIRLAMSLLRAAPNLEFLVQLRGAIGHAQWLRCLYPGALESLEFKQSPVIGLENKFIRTLGTFGLEENAKLKPWKAQKARDLLALLICAFLEEGSGYLSREQILDAIWNNNDPSTADGAFRVTISRLRDSLGDAAKIERNPQGHYGLISSKLDATKFLEAIGNHDLEHAISWYNGDFLIGIELEKADLLREKLKSKWRQALFTLAFESHDARAASLFETLLESDPLDLEALQGLSKSWQALGTNLRLLRILEKSKDRFIEEIGETPIELLELLHQVRGMQLKGL